MTEDDEGRRGIDRRRALKLGGAALAAGWVAPVVLTSPASAATTSGIPVNAACNGHNCASGTIPGGCFPSKPTLCFCYETPAQLGVCETAQLCANLKACPKGQGDCPAGTVCCITCCPAVQVCIVLTDVCGNLPVIVGNVAQAPAAGEGEGPTTAHR